nr:hypothetical protein [Haloactinomyces albus]
MGAGYSTSPDAAAADDRHRVTTGDLTSVDRRSDPGHDPAAEQPGHRGPRGRIDPGALPGVHQGAFGKRADAQRRRQRRAVQGHRLGGLVSEQGTETRR